MSIIIQILDSKRFFTLIRNNYDFPGLDIPIVDCVINHDVPFPSEYVHRIGRTGRVMGKAGVAVTLLTPRQIPFLTKIEKGIARKLHEFKVSGK